MEAAFLWAGARTLSTTQPALLLALPGAAAPPCPALLAPLMAEAGLSTEAGP